MAGERYFFQAVPYLFRIFGLRQGDGGHAGDGVQRSSDIMGHLGKEIALRLIGFFGCLICRQQRFAVALLLLFLFLDAVGCQYHLHRHSIAAFRKNNMHPHPSIGTAVISAVFKSINHIAPGNSSADVASRQLFHKPFPIFLMNEIAINRFQIFIVRTAAETAGQIVHQIKWLE